MVAILGLLLRAVYALRLRRLVNTLQRRLKGEHRLPRMPLLEVKQPQDVLDFAKAEGYKWRADTIRIGKRVLPLDWVTDPEVFQWKLVEDPDPEGTDDCDGFHSWVAAVLEPIAEDVVRISTVWSGGGHTTCCYKIDGQWMHCNYYTLEPVDDPTDAPAKVLEWAKRAREAKGETDVRINLRFWVVEELNFLLRASSYDAEHR